MKKLWDKFGNIKTLAVAFTAFATGYGLFMTPDIMQFLANYLAGGATALAIEMCADDL